MGKNYMAIKIKGNPVIDDNENLSIDGNANIEGELRVFSPSYLNNTLNVTHTATLNSLVRINGGLRLDGASMMHDNKFVMSFDDALNEISFNDSKEFNVIRIKGGNGGEVNIDSSTFNVDSSNINFDGQVNIPKEHYVYQAVENADGFIQYVVQRILMQEIVQI